MFSTLGQRIRNAFSKGVKDTSGTATVEAVLWLPFIFGIFGIIVDGSLIFHGRSQAYRVVQDANRARSTGRYDNATTAAYVKTVLLPLSPNATAVTNVNNDTGVVTTTVTLPTYDLMAVGILSAFEFNMTISSSHFIEYWSNPDAI